VRRVVPAVALAVVAGVASVSAQPAGDPAQQTFVREYMAALASKDVAALERQIHPASRACMNEANRDFFDFVFARALDSRPAASYQLTDVSPAPAGGPPFWPAGFARYPVRPTHQVQIDFETAPGRHIALVRVIARSGGAWFEVMPCPTAEGLQAFRRRQGTAR
jgi:hypothetical protein